MLKPAVRSRKPRNQSPKRLTNMLNRAKGIVKPTAKTSAASNAKCKFIPASLIKRLWHMSYSFSGLELDRSREAIGFLAARFWCNPTALTSSYHTLLRSTTLYYTLLHSITLYYALLRCTTRLYYALLRSTPLYYTLLRSTTLYYALLRSTTLYYALLHSTTLVTIEKLG